MKKNLSINSPRCFTEKFRQKLVFGALRYYLWRRAKSPDKMVL